MWPNFLRFSFYALLLHYTDPFYYSNRKQVAIAFYTESAQKSVDDLASQGIASIQIIHSLCFLSLVDILGMNGLDLPIRYPLVSVSALTQDRKTSTGMD